MYNTTYRNFKKLKISILSYSFVQKVPLNCLFVSQGSWPTKARSAVLCVSSSSEEHPARARSRGAAPTHLSVDVAWSASRWRSRHVQPLQNSHGDQVTSGSSLNERPEGGMSSFPSTRRNKNKLQRVLTARIVRLKWEENKIFFH